VNSPPSQEPSAAVGTPAVWLRKTGGEWRSTGLLAPTKIAGDGAQAGAKAPASTGSPNPLWIIAGGIGVLFAAMAALLATGYQ
jgi:hypothetical protein